MVSAEVLVGIGAICLVAVVGGEYAVVAEVIVKQDVHQCRGGGCLTRCMHGA